MILFFVLILEKFLIFGKLFWVNYVKGVIVNFLGEIFIFDVMIVILVFLGGGLFSFVFFEVVIYIFFEKLIGKE